MDYMKLFSTRLRKRREELKLSQTDLGNAVGVHRTSIGAYEDGKRMPTLDVFNRMSDVLQVEPGWLIGLKDEVESCADVPVYQIPKPGQPLESEDNIIGKEAVKARSNIEFCFVVNDNAMEGIRIIPGDIVFINKKHPIASGDVVAVNHPELGVMIRRMLIRKEENKVILHAESMTVHNLVFEKDQWRDDWLIGWVADVRLGNVY